MRILKRVSALFLVLTMLCTMLPMSVFAAYKNVTVSFSGTVNTYFNANLQSGGVYGNDVNKQANVSADGTFTGDGYAGGAATVSGKTFTYNGTVYGFDQQHSNSETGLYTANYSSIVAFAKDTNGYVYVYAYTGENSITITNGSFSMAAGEQSSIIDEGQGNTAIPVTVAASQMTNQYGNATIVLDNSKYVEGTNATVTAASGSASGSASGTVTGTAMLVPNNNDLVITITPDQGSYVWSYTVTANGQTYTQPEGFDPTSSAVTVTIPQANISGNIEVTPVLEKGIDVNYNAAAGRPDGYLAWKDTTLNNNDQVSYKYALGANYNAYVIKYLLDSNFGASVTQGQQLFANPKASIVMTYSNDTSSGSSELEDLGKLTTSGQSPATNVELTVAVDKSAIFPGKVTQSVLADYYTGGSICSNHWYHVYNVEYREDGMTRTFTILKDIISLYNGDGTASPVGTTYEFTGSDAGDPQIAISNPTLLPDSYGMDGTQVGEWTEADKANFAIYRVADAEGKALAEAEEIVDGDYTKAGTYAVRVKQAVEGNKYLSSYEAGATVQEFTVTRGTNPTKMEAIAVEIHADNLVVTGATNGVQEYSIDGINWVKPTDGKVVFSGLTEDTAYTIKTRIAQTDAWNAKIDATNAPDVEVTTYVKVQGTVSVDAGSAPMETPVTVTFAQGDKTYPATVAVDENGATYTAEVPAGKHTVTAVGGDELQKATASVTIADDDKDNPGTVDTVDNLELKDTDKGLAKKWMDKNLKDGDGYVNTVSSATIDKILAADAQATKDGLTTGVRNEMSGELLGYKKADDTYGSFAEMVAAAKAQVTATGDEYYGKIGRIANMDAEALAELVETKMDTLAPLVEKWDSLSDAEKAEVNRRLGGDFADVMTEFNKQLTEATNAFVKDYLTEADGSITGAVSEANYQNILAGGNEFFKEMNNTRRAAVNGKLAEGVTYEQLYADAYKVKLEKDKAALTNPPLADKQIEELKAAMNGALNGAMTIITDPNASVADKALAQAKLDAKMKVLDMISKQYAAINSGATDGAATALTDAVTARLMEGALSKIDAADDTNTVEVLLAAAESVNDLIGKARQAVEDINNNPWLTDGQKAGFVADINEKVEAVVAATTPDDVKAATDKLAAQLATTGDEVAAQAFVNKNLSAKNGDGYTVYKAVTSQNADQIFDSQAEHAALTADQQKLVDELIHAANGSDTNAPQSYDDFMDAVDELIAATVADFIPKYVTDAAGKLITVVNDETYGKLMSGKSTWDALSKAEQKAIDDELIAKGGKAYSELIAAAEKMEANANSFVAKYVSDTDGIVYPKATKDNYSQILSGRSAWNAMTQAEKNAINAKIFAQAGTTYEELVKGALEMQSLYAPKTGDTANGALWAGLLLTSLTGLAVLVARKRKYN